MPINFLPPQPVDELKDKSNKWRAIIAVVCVFIGFGAVLTFLKIDIFNPVIKVVKSFPVAESKNIGGDIVVEPPVVEKPKLPELQGEMIGGENFSAKAMFVKDQETGAVLFAKNEYTPRPIASITKLMSALVILEKNPDWTTSTMVIGVDSMGTHMYAGDVYTFEELWLAALVGSSNKAILTLANALGWPEQAFVERMNQKAKELGMLDTRFVDPTGLDAGNISTASDVVTLLKEAMSHDEIMQAVLLPELNLYSEQRGKSHHMWNTDWLLLGWVTHDFVNFHGGKTGYIPASGYNFTMQVGDGDNNIIDIVVLGADLHEARFIEARDIAKWVFSNYKFNK